MPSPSRRGRANLAVGGRTSWFQKYIAAAHEQIAGVGRTLKNAAPGGYHFGVRTWGPGAPA
jgi:hypothetical protein